FADVFDDVDDATLFGQVPNLVFGFGRVYLGAGQHGDARTSEAQSAQTHDSDSFSGPQLTDGHHAAVGGLARVGGSGGLSETDLVGKFDETLGGGEALVGESAVV